MGSGCGDSIVDKILRPPGKLPVPVALNALSPTLFTAYYTPAERKSKELFGNSVSIWQRKQKKAASEEAALKIPLTY